MKYLILLLSMIFCHIIDDFYLQGILASMKQKRWQKVKEWSPLYENDYLAALIIHAFSWTFMIHLPLFVYLAIFNISFPIIVTTSWFIINWYWHAVIDNEKENKLSINLCKDQFFHLIQIIILYLIYIICINI